MSTVTDLESYQQFALQQQAANNAWSAEQAQKQMDFQREMSNTAHQREVVDLKAAGLNPILSANSGASVPNGAAGDTDTSAAANVGQILQQVLSAQSAREVAGMYNAATLAAAQIAANASMYGSDMAYWNNEDHPNTMEAVAARVAQQAAAAVGGVGAHAPGTGSSSSGSNSSGRGPQTSAQAQARYETQWQQNLFDAGRRLAAAQYPTDPNRKIWKEQVLPFLRERGFDTHSETLMKAYYYLWLKNPSEFIKRMTNARSGNGYTGRFGKF